MNFFWWINIDEYGDFYEINSLLFVVRINHLIYYQYPFVDAIF